MTNINILLDSQYERATVEETGSKMYACITCQSPQKQLQTHPGSHLPQSPALLSDSKGLIILSRSQEPAKLLSFLTSNTKRQCAVCTAPGFTYSYINSSSKDVRSVHKPGVCIVKPEPEPAADLRGDAQNHTEPIWAELDKLKGGSRC
jgi:hypothetical protein